MPSGTSIVFFMNTMMGKLLLLSLLVCLSHYNLYYGVFFLLSIVIFYRYYGFDSYSIYKHDFLHGIDQVYWINLERSTERRQHMLKMFQDESFKHLSKKKCIKRINAIDGTSYPVFDKLKTNEINNTKVEYACLLSHLEAIREFAESDNDTALIMEDDVTLEFKPYWNKSIQEIIDRAPYNWEMIQLCYITSKQMNKEYTLNSNYGKANQYGNTASLAAYIINKKSAIKFIGEHYDESTQRYKLRNYHTHEADHYLFKCLRTYIYKYPMFIYPTENDSTLHPSDLTSHVLSKRRIIQIFNNK